MKVLDLECREGHVFEGWFGSEQDFSSQLDRCLITCPACGNADISKRLSAPRLNLGKFKGHDAFSESKSGTACPTSPESTPKIAPGAQNMVQLQAAWLLAARKLIASTEDVGAQFAAEARKMHYGDTPERAIRGQASIQDAIELMDEGIDVMPMVMPEALKTTLQ